MDDVTQIIDDFRRVCKKVQPDLNATMDLSLRSTRELLLKTCLPLLESCIIHL